ncbi:MAG: FecR family protein [Pseudomonadota bacterium]
MSDDRLDRARTGLAPRALMAATMLAVSLAAVGAAAEPPPIGEVTQEEYKGALGRLPDREDKLIHQVAVFSQERVTTPLWGQTALGFHDGTSLQVGPGSEVTLDEFVYDPNQSLTKAVINFNHGLFRFVTGETTHKEGVTLNTPVATLSIRGTDLIIQVDLDGTTTVSVLKGAIAAKSCDRPQETTVQAGFSLVVKGNCSEKEKTVPYTPTYGGLFGITTEDGRPNGPGGDREHSSGGGNSIR